ncbi:MAG: hypothetical protein C4290_02590 [Chloroflexota bacterium]
MDHDVYVALAAGRAAVLAAYAQITAAELDRRPPGEGWSAWEVAYHLLDIERWYIAKLCEATTSDRAAALARLLTVWTQLREETLALAHAVPPERLDRPGLLSGVPDWTPRRLLAAIAAHDHEHAAQVRATRAMERPGESTPSAAPDHTSWPLDAPRAEPG